METKIAMNDKTLTSLPILVSYVLVFSNNIGADAELVHLFTVPQRTRIKFSESGPLYSKSLKTSSCVQLLWSKDYMYTYVTLNIHVPSTKSRQLIRNDANFNQPLVLNSEDSDRRKILCLTQKPPNH